MRGGGVLVASTPLRNHNNSSFFSQVGSRRHQISGLATPKEACYYYNNINRQRRSAGTLILVVSSAKKQKNEEEAETNETKKRKQNLFESVTEALDFAQVRSEEDAQLLDDARKATKSGSKMTREQVMMISYIYWYPLRPYLLL